MFSKTNKDPLVESARKVIAENDIRRKVERQINEEIGIQSRKQLPREMLADYDAVLAEATKKALDKVGKEDEDIDNDRDVDKEDEYLHNRRKAISAAMSKGKKLEETKTVEEQTDAQQAKVADVMGEFKRGELHSGKGKKGKKGKIVRKRSQAIAIALNQAGLSKQQNEEVTAESVLAEIRASMSEEAFNELMEGIGYNQSGSISPDYGRGRTWGPVNPITGVGMGDNTGAILKSPNAAQVAQNLDAAGAPEEVVQAGYAAIGNGVRPDAPISPNRPNLQQRMSDIAQMAPQTSGYAPSATGSERVPVAKGEVPSTPAAMTGPNAAQMQALRDTTASTEYSNKIARGLADYQNLAKSIGKTPTQKNIDYNRRQIVSTLADKGDQFDKTAKGRYEYLRTGQGNIREELDTDQK